MPTFKRLNFKFISFQPFERKGHCSTLLYNFLDGQLGCLKEKLKKKKIITNSSGVKKCLISNFKIGYFILSDFFKNRMIRTVYPVNKTKTQTSEVSFRRTQSHQLQSLILFFLEPGASLVTLSFMSICCHRPSLSRP